MAGIDKPLLNPYPGARPFEAEESDYFFGRTEEIEILAGLVKAHRATLFFAQSGAGKSSLLRAGLIARLTRPRQLGRGRSTRTYQDMEVLPILSVGSAIPEDAPKERSNIYVFSALLSLLPDTPAAELALLTLIEGVERYLVQQQVNGTGPAASQTPGAAPDSYLLVFDQFEEMFTHHLTGSGEREEFFRQVTALLQARPTLRVLFTMREDYIAELVPYLALLPEQLRPRFRMERLKPQTALAAVRYPAERAGRRYAPGVAEELVANLSGMKDEKQAETTAGLTVEAYVEPVHLQIVCRQLWDKLPPDQDEIELQDLRDFGDVDQALIKFYEDTLQGVVADPEVNLSERRLRLWFNDQLITPALTRGLVYRDEQKGETAGLPNRAVDLLYEAFIIRAIKRGRDTWYELAHDRLVTPILKSNAAWQITYNNPLAKATQTWLEADRSPGKLLRGAALNEAKAFASAHPDDVTDIEQKFLDECSQRLKPLAAATQIWLEAGRNPDLLLRGPQLGEAKTFAAENPGEVVAEEREFLETSLRQEAFEQEQARQVARRRRYAIIAASVTILILAGLTAWAMGNAARANENAAEADTARKAAETQQFIAEAANTAVVAQKETAEAEKLNALSALAELTRQAGIAEGTAVALTTVTAAARATQIANLEATLTVQPTSTSTFTPEPTLTATLSGAPTPPTETATPPVAGSTATATATPTSNQAAIELAQLQTAQAQIECKFEPQGEFAELWNSHKGKLGCPVQLSPVGGFFAVQLFEDGLMFWVQIPDLYLFFDNSEARWQAHQGAPAQLNPSGPACTPPAQPKPGQMIPIRGFGGIWCQESLWDSIGFATRPERGVGENLLQEFEHGYIMHDVRDDPGGRILANFILIAEDDQNTGGTFTRESH